MFTLLTQLPGRFTYSRAFSRAHKVKLQKSYILHETDSIVVIATTKSKNRKTGAGIQLWIIDARMHPSDSRKTGADALNQCRGCPLASYQGCYVMDMAPIAIYRAWKAGKYQALILGSEQWDLFFKDRFVRFGAYGNPSLIPLPMVQSIAGLAKRFTGYFHDWHLMPPERAKAYGKFFMASAHPSTFTQAKALGLRTFTTGDSVNSRAYGIECLADSHGITCAQCGLCDGNNRRSNLPDIWIQTHGYQTSKANNV